MTDLSSEPTQSTNELGNVVFVADWSRLNSYTGPTRLQTYDRIAQLGGAHCVGPANDFFQPGMSTGDLLKSLGLNGGTVVVIPQLGRRQPPDVWIRRTPSSDVTILYDIQDMHTPRVYADLVRTHDVDAILHRYDAPELDDLKQQLGDHPPMFWFPHYIPTDVHYDRGLPKTIDVLLYGACSPAYPFRTRLRKLLASASSLRVRILKHPGDYRRASTIVTEDLSRVINHSWLTVSTRSSYDYFLFKYLEAPLNSSTILGDVPSRHEKLFGDEVVRIDSSLSDEQVLATVHGALKDKHALRKKTETLSDRLREQFSIERGFDAFRRIVAQTANMAIRHTVPPSGGSTSTPMQDSNEL